MEIWKEPEYKLVTTFEALDELLDVLRDAVATETPISVDVETTGPTPKSPLDVYHGWLLGISFCTNKEIGYYIPINHTSNGEPLIFQILLKDVVEAINPIVSSGGIYLAHNAKFDYSFLWQAGFTFFPNFWCTMIAHQLLAGGIKQSHKLKDLVKKYVDIPIGVIQTFAEAAGDDAAETDPIDFCTYAINDVFFAYYLYEEFKPRIDKDYHKLFYKAEAPLTTLLAQMEMRGIRIDTPYYISVRHPLEKCRTKISKVFEEGYKINIASPKQLSDFMLKTFPSETNDMDRSLKTGALKTDVEALQKIKRRFNKTDSIHKFAKHILFFRGINKALSTYIDKYPAICHKHYNKDGVVESILHTQFRQIVNSGRQSSSPNVQNITRDNEVLSVRKGFTARKGMWFAEADWKGMELRLVTIDSQDPKMTEAFIKDPLNADLHLLTAQIIFAKNNITDAERNIGKTINFSILYGATEYSVSKTLNCSREQASEYLRIFYQTYTGIAKWKKDTERKIRDVGYTETFYGRRRYLNSGSSPSMRERWKWEGAVRELTNHIIQGTSADILKFSMVAVAKELANANLNSYLITTTHDSMVVETTEPEETAKIMKKVMEVTINKILLPVDVIIKKTFAKR